MDPDQGVGALLSFGIAGALDPEIDCGELIVAEWVKGAEGETFPCHPGWRENLARRLGEAALHPRGGGLLASTRTLLEPADKTAAYRDSGCLATDMESGAVGAIAAEGGLPFLAVRAVAGRQWAAPWPRWRGVLPTSRRPSGWPGRASWRWPACACWKR